MKLPAPKALTWNEIGLFGAYCLADLGISGQVQSRVFGQTFSQIPYLLFFVGLVPAAIWLIYRLIGHLRSTE